MSDFSKIMEIITGFWESKTLLVANEYDVFTNLYPRGQTALSLSKKINTDCNATERILNTLVALNLLIKKNNTFFNTPLAEKYLVKNKPDYRGEILNHYNDLWNSWNNLSEAVKYGFSENFLKDKKFLNNFSKIRSFIHGLDNVGQSSAYEVAKKLPLKNVKKILDLGGCGGTFSQAIVKRNPKIKCVIFDLPKIVSIAKEIIAKNKMGKSIETISGDFNNDSIPGKYDLILISKVNHIENRENNIKIFKKCYKVLNMNGKIAIHDFMLNKSHTVPLFSTLFALNMLVRTPRGGVYSAEEYKDWMKIAGFGNFKISKIPHQTELLIAIKK